VCGYVKSETPDKCANQRVGQRPSTNRSSEPKLYLFTVIYKPAITSSAHWSPIIRLNNAKKT